MLKRPQRESQEREAGRQSHQLRGYLQLRPLQGPEYAPRWSTNSCLSNPIHLYDCSFRNGIGRTHSAGHGLTAMDNMVGSTYKDDGNLGSHCEYDLRVREKIRPVIVIVIALMVVGKNLVMALLDVAFIPFVVLNTLVRASFDEDRPSGSDFALDCNRSLQLDLTRIDKN